ncbi:MAG: hypothetical protein OEV73_08150 [Desulfobulbaceae bacterium]|nr:hypothetical protein [Desulfobulbaceae bacterium]
MDGWLWSALTALVFYGLWGFFPKLAVGYISPKSVLVYEVGGTLLVWLVALQRVSFRPEAILRASSLPLLFEKFVTVHIRCLVER